MKKLVILPALITLLVSGCTQHAKVPEAPKTFTIATRQLPPEPVFKSTRWVRPPEVAPLRNLPTRSSSPQISPIFQYKVTKAPLKEAVLVLAAPLSYQSYCSTQIAERKLTLDHLGTIPEIAKEIEKLADIQVVVDHQLKEVRFLSR